MNKERLACRKVANEVSDKLIEFYSVGGGLNRPAVLDYLGELPPAEFINAAAGMADLAEQNRRFHNLLMTIGVERMKDEANFIREAMR